MIPEAEAALRAAIVRLATHFGRYGYRRITALLRAEGWRVNHKRVERIWRQEGLKVPRRQPKRGRLWLTDGSCIRLRPTHRRHVRAYDLMVARIDDWRQLRLLTVIDEFTRECLAIEVARHIRADDVLHCLTRLMVGHGVPAHLRADNGPEFTARAVRTWLWPALGPRPSSSSPAAPGKTARSRASTGSCATSCSTARSSTPSGKPRSSSSAGDGPTTRSGPTALWATGHQLLRRSGPHRLG